MIDYFDTTGTGVNPDGYWSARATGVPLLAAMILPEDVEAGAIKHALGFAIPGPRNTNTSNPSEPYSSDYLSPASTTETDYFNSNPYALAAGQRIRLKQTIVNEAGNTIDESQLAPITRMFLEALRNYGAYLIDNASGFSFYAEDIHTAVLNLSDSAVNTLIGQSQGTPLPGGKTKWQIVMEKLNEELESIPIAFGPWVAGQDPATASISVSNFEVVETANGGSLRSLDLTVSPSTVSAGDQVTIGAHADQYNGSFDAWAVIIPSNGQIYSMSLSGGLEEGAVAIALSVPCLPADRDVTLLNMTVPTGIPTGNYTVAAAFFPPGTKPSSLEDAENKAIAGYFDRENLTVNP